MLIHSFYSENSKQVLHWSISCCLFFKQALLLFFYQGLLPFYEVLAFIYFAGAIAYGQRLWQTIEKGGPMHLVCTFPLWLLTLKIIYQNKFV